MAASFVSETESLLSLPVHIRRGASVRVPTSSCFCELLEQLPDVTEETAVDADTAFRGALRKRVVKSARVPHHTLLGQLRDYKPHDIRLFMGIYRLPRHLPDVEGSAA